MDADEDGVGKLVREGDAVFKRNGLVAGTGHLHFEPGAQQLVARAQRHVERVGLLVAERPGRPAVCTDRGPGSSTTVSIGLETVDPVRAQDRLDDFGNVRRRDQVVVALGKERVITKEPDAVDVILARPRLRPDSTPIPA